jgi:hypothetical protein
MFGVCTICRKERGMNAFKLVDVDDGNEPQEEFKWFELFDFIEENDYDGYCEHELKAVQMFCNDNDLDFDEVKRKLHLAGGFCDCEVILNARNEIRGNDIMPKRIR